MIQVPFSYKDPDVLLDDLLSSSKNSSIRLVGHSGPVYSCKLFQNFYTFILSASQDSTVLLWNSLMKSPLACYKGHVQPIWDLQLSFQDNYFVTASADKSARLWKTDNTSSIRIFSGHTNDVDVVKFHPNCNYVATGSSDKSCRMWDIHDSHSVRVFQGHLRGISALCFSENGKYLFSSDGTGDIHIFDISEGKKIRTLTNLRFTQSSFKIVDLFVSMDGRSLYCSLKNGSIHIYDIQKILSNASETECCILVLTSKCDSLITVCSTRGGSITTLTT